MALEKQSLDRLGCYRVGDLKFHSKLEAIELHARTGLHPHWDFNDAVYSSYDWKKEPATDLTELYRVRALSLREKYDYIVLLYSGGSDSENALQSFVDNDIHLDEVASFINYDATSNRDHFLNSEFFRVALPRIENLKTTCPWLKHRAIDVTELTLELFNDKTQKFDWIYNQNMYFTANCAARSDIGMKIREWRDIVESGKKLCLLWGADKPRIMHVNNRYCMRFIDMLDISVKSIAGTNPYVDECFYWTPDMPEIVIKQAHVIKRYLEHSTPDTPFMSYEKSDLAFREYNGRKLWLSNHGMHRLIYPGWDINTFSAGKSPSIIYSARDDWFWGLEEPNLAKEIWEMGVKKMWDLLPNYWKNNPQDIHKGLKGCLSKEYFLE